MVVGLFLQAFGFFGGSLDNLFLQLEQLGFFTYALPFLIIFALVFGILTNIKIFGENKTIYAVLALSVSLLALQFGIVTQFFSDIFPRLGIWLSVILVGLIIIGLLNPTNKWNKGIMVILGVIIVGIVLYQTFGLSWYTGYWIPYYWPELLAVAAVIFVVGAIIANTKPKKPFSLPETLTNVFKSAPYNS